MSWNNGYERRKFEALQEKLAKEYREQGMTEEQIKKAYDLALEQFNSDRRYYEHVQSLEPYDFDSDEDNEEKLSIYQKYPDQFTCTIENSDGHSRYWWIEEIENVELYKKVKALRQDQIELITLHEIEQYTYDEIASMQGCSVSAIGQKWQTILKKLK